MLFIGRGVEVEGTVFDCLWCLAQRNVLVVCVKFDKKKVLFGLKNITLGEKSSQY